MENMRAEHAAISSLIIIHGDATDKTSETRCPMQIAPLAANPSDLRFYIIKDVDAHYTGEVTNQFEWVLQIMARHGVEVLDIRHTFVDRDDCYPHWSVLIIGRKAETPSDEAAKSPVSRASWPQSA